ncbi:hypothetical protein LEP1GSC047_2662 [Leptospira inadai serovar Lyme str. 10]|uniref:Nucleotide-diphospho-sugar transferase n=2 Tax=Leptospira inadai serovar Lyme TaxID=293084 RepID=V6HBW4_9LEPT|nr:hypothetical protein [Leptospira inadai]EQA36992.1 hypothetical protein LEP1GSC047_2662 [Leptospira inadai serovar Lyme str. 10]PNV75818.1 nucleotide-diphospho-sugar transferase [Leptospira inadai serovar Lyme]
MSKVPILLLIFNRPDSARKVVEAIGEYKPERIYIAADGPREDRSEEKVCHETREIVESNITWKCEVARLYREGNLGCKRAVTGAIDWFFENEVEGIILEDDCIPTLDFFRFCEEGIEKYRNEEKVMHIAGTNFVPVSSDCNMDAYFSRYPHVWGWATWRNSWSCYLRDDTVWKKEGLSPWNGSPRKVREFWNHIFEKTYSNKIDTWDFQWVYTINYRKGMALNSSVNLIKNIGFGEDATHTRSTDDDRSDMKVGNLSESLTFPASIELDRTAINWLEKKHYSIEALPNRIFRFAIRFLKNLQR